ncbi:MAG: hypothetical protein HS130_11760 [Deltaproteobacteria bacterium]|nr:hypothetical protein [Deltaproteobacteria bacterium]
MAVVGKNITRITVYETPPYSETSLSRHDEAVELAKLPAAPRIQRPSALNIMGKVKSEEKAPELRAKQAGEIFGETF